MRRLNHAHIAYSHDIVMSAASVLVAFYLRMGEGMFDLPAVLVGGSAGLFALLAAATYWPMGLYRGIWRYASMNDLLQITKAVTVVCVLFVPAMFLVSRAEGLPRSLPIINWFVLMILLGAPRFAYRRFRDSRANVSLSDTNASAIPVLLVGAGDEAETFIRAMQRSANAEYQVVGVLDEKGNRVGRRIHDVPVIGKLDTLEEAVGGLKARNLRPQRVIVTKRELGGELIRDLLDRADALGISLARLPELTDFKTGAMDKLEIRPIDVEDLLGRAQARLDRDAMRQLVEGRNVLVTGAGGSIGSELARQVAALAPAELVLVDNSEFNLYAVDLELADLAPALARRSLLADVRDKDRIGRVLKEARPDLVFHAAALKHVPIVESHPCEGILTNVIGTRNVAEACRATGVGAMVLISTDKAVNPSNVMGATKRAAETYCQALDVAALNDTGSADGGDDAQEATRFVIVRFGNVLGSTGSVVPLFQKQLARGGPLTVTHPDVTRYFMTIREAVELVLQASTLHQDSPGHVLVLDMGEPVKIMDLARQMIRLSGRKPDQDVKIDIVGLRDGEKLHERLFYAEEKLQPTLADGVMLAAPRAADQKMLEPIFGELERAAKRQDSVHAAAILGQIVPEFSPQPNPGGRTLKVAAAND
jgi:O-antigen biosynthesis protein WbqV